MYLVRNGKSISNPAFKTNQYDLLAQFPILKYTQ